MPLQALPEARAREVARRATGRVLQPLDGASMHLLHSEAIRRNSGLLQATDYMGAGHPGFAQRIQGWTHIAAFGAQRCATEGSDKPDPVTGPYTHSVRRVGHRLRQLPGTGEQAMDRLDQATLGAYWESAFSVVTRWRTYSRLLYLVLGLPLGMMYVAFLVTAISISGGLSIIGVGLLLLLGVLGGLWMLLGIERELAVLLLRVDLPVVRSPEYGAAGPIGQLRAYLADKGTWRALAFLMAKLPLGALSFALSLLAIAMASTLVAAPVTYWVTDIDLGIWRIDQFWEAIIAFFLGLPAGLAALHLIDAMGAFYGRIARVAMTAPGSRQAGSVDILHRYRLSPPLHLREKAGVRGSAAEGGGRMARQRRRGRPDDQVD